jgi:Ca2+:H+ antiporter
MSGRFLTYSFRYICSRIFLHNPPGEDNALSLARHVDAPEELRERERHYETGDPEVKVWACLLMLAVTIAIMAATAEWVSYS